MGDPTSADNGGPPVELDLAPGQSRAIELRGLGTAGYRWDHSVDGPPGVVKIEWERGYPPGTAPTVPVGRSAPETVTVTGLAAGEVTMLLAQRRPWESVPSRASHEMRVRVRAPGSGSE